MPANDVNEWLTRAEESVHRAAASLPASEADLETAAEHLRTAPFRTPLDHQTLQRLDGLRRELMTLQILSRHGIALHVGLEQLDQNSVIGYTPSGLEHAL